MKVAFFAHGCAEHAGRLEREQDQDALGEERVENPPGEANRQDVDWCDAKPIIVERCWRCHTDPPRNGAPFALKAYEDTQRMVMLASGIEYPLYEQMLQAIASDTMPPTYFRLEPEVKALSCSERETLLAWLGDGAPPEPEGLSCDEIDARLLACGKPLEQREN